MWRSAARQAIHRPWPSAPTTLRGSPQRSKWTASRSRNRDGSGCRSRRYQQREANVRNRRPGGPGRWCDTDPAVADRAEARPVHGSGKNSRPASKPPGSPALVNQRAFRASTRSPPAVSSSESQHPLTRVAWLTNAPPRPTPRHGRFRIVIGARDPDDRDAGYRKARIASDEAATSAAAASRSETRTLVALCQEWCVGLPAAVSAGAIRADETAGPERSRHPALPPRPPASTCSESFQSSSVRQSDYVDRDRRKLARCGSVTSVLLWAVRFAIRLATNRLRVRALCLIRLLTPNTLGRPRGAVARRQRTGGLGLGRDRWSCAEPVVLIGLCSRW